MFVVICTRKGRIAVVGPFQEWGGAMRYANKFNEESRGGWTYKAQSLDPLPQDWS